MKRVLIIDAQVFQTVAWHRGMGKYSTELITAMAQLNKIDTRWDAIEIVLSSRLPLEDGVIRILNQKMEAPEFIYLDLSRDEITNATAVMGHNRKILDEHVSELIENSSDDLELEFLILSPMQGGVCSVFPTNPVVHKGAVFYDLIPFMFHEIYFRNNIAEMEFLTKLVELLKADVYLAISKTVANDLAIYLGVDPSRIKSIDGGPIEHAKKSKKINISKPFILMPTGNDLRKNNRVGIQGFNEFNRQHNNNYTLVITSYFDPDQVAELSKIAEKVVFTGNISGEQLNYLYEECDILLFPSEYEGLGLPVLEAVEKNKPVACSDIMVFREISRNAFQFFDPSYGTAIAAALEQALITEIDKDLYAEVLSRYTWEASARAAMKAFEMVIPTRHDIKKLITVFAPNPEARSMAARTVQRLHSELSRRYAPNYFTEGVYENNTPRPNMLPYVAETLNVSNDVPMNIKDESLVTLYHINGDENSSKTLFAALANPGIVILHALDMSAAWQGLVDDKLITGDRYKLEVSLTKKFDAKGANMLISLISSQKVVIVFSEKSKKHIQDIAQIAGIKVQIIIAHYPVSSLVYKDLVPAKKNIIGAVNLIPKSHTMAVFDELHNPLFDKLHIADSTAQSNSTQDRSLPTVKVINDRYFENNISRLDLIFSASDYANIASLEASRYGVVSVSLFSSSSGGIDLPSSTLAISGIGELNRIVDRFALDDGKIKSAAQAQNAIETSYSYRHFVEQLEEVIDGISKESNV